MAQIRGKRQTSASHHGAVVDQLVRAQNLASHGLRPVATEFIHISFLPDGQRVAPSTLEMSLWVLSYRALPSLAAGIFPTSGVSHAMSELQDANNARQNLYNPILRLYCAGDLERRRVYSSTEAVSSVKLNASRSSAPNLAYSNSRRNIYT